MNVHELSDYQLYQLKSIDPALSTNWKAILIDILPKLDKLSRQSIYEKILSKRNLNPNFNYIVPENLRDVLSKSAMRSHALKRISAEMLALIDSTPISYDAVELADKVEAMLDYLMNIDVGDNLLDQTNRQRIKNAFLYDLTNWIDHIDINVKSGVRQLNTDIVKVYFKEVFIKQRIYGRNFRAWDSTDIDFQEEKCLPYIIKQEAKRKKFLVVESEKYWFLIGIADKPNQNPYSFSRFLHEDTSGGHTFVFLTHIVVRKDLLSDSRYIEHITYCMSRMYTLDIGVSDNVIQFVQQSQYICKKQIYPLLLKPLKKDGTNTEYNIHQRMIEYERQITISLLNRLPNIINTSIDDNSDRDYLFYYLDKIFNKTIDRTQDFQLQPIATYSHSVEIVIARLIGFRYLLNNLYEQLQDKHFKVETLAQTSESVLENIKISIENTEKDLSHIKRLEDKIQKYYSTHETGNLW